MCLQFNFKGKTGEKFEIKFYKSGSIGKSVGELHNNTLHVDKDSMDILFIKFRKL
jgi:hypothetical protein